MPCTQKRIHFQSERGAVTIFAGEAHMPGKRFTAEKIINMLREAEVLLSTGKSAGEVCRELKNINSFYGQVFV